MSISTSQIIDYIVLRNFRNYTYYEGNFSESCNIIYGDNGVGKTSLLEAISHLSVGKGLRGGSLEELVKKGFSSCFVSARVKNNFGEYKLSYNIQYNSESERYKKSYLMDDDPISKTNFFNYDVGTVWITPQMDNFFLQDNTLKRKFIDKLISTFDKSHIVRLLKYNKLIKERNKLLSQGNFNSLWLDVVEKNIVESSLPIVISRLHFADEINKYSNKQEKHSSTIFIEGDIESLLSEHIYSLKVENILKEKLKNNRKKDAIRGFTSLGAHRSRLVCKNNYKNYLAEQGSTGEQKMMLIILIFSFIQFLQNNKQIQPILLLDEVNIHLDQVNTDYVMDMILKFKSQSFVTTTNKNIYSNFTKDLMFFNV